MGEQSDNDDKWLQLNGVKISCQDNNTTLLSYRVTKILRTYQIKMQDQIDLQNPDVI